MADLTAQSVTATISSDGTTVTITGTTDRAITVASYSRNVENDVAENQTLFDSVTVQATAGQENMITVDVPDCGQTDVFFSDSAPEVPTLENLYLHAFYVGAKYGECVPEATTTTTVPVTTTTMPQETTTTVPAVSVPSSVPVTSTTILEPSQPILPHTGSMTGDVALTGVSVLLAGVVIVARAKARLRIGR